MQKIAVSILLPVFVFTQISLTFAYQNTKEMLVKLSQGNNVVGNKGSAQNIQEGASYQIIRKTMDGEIKIGTAVVYVIREKASGLKAKINDGFTIQKGDILRLQITEEQNILDELSKTLSHPAEIELSPELTKQYDDKKLSIRLKGAYTSFMDDVTMLKTYPNYKKWQAYQGGKKISEVKFFKITGNKSASYQADSYKIDMGGGFLGVLALGLGGYMAYSGFTKKSEETIGNITIKYEDPNNAQGVTGIGICVLGIGIIGAVSVQSGKNWAPYALASKTAKDYNNLLLIELKNVE